MYQFTSIFNNNYYEHTLSKVQACRSRYRMSNVNNSQLGISFNAMIALVFVYAGLILAPLTWKNDLRQYYVTTNWKERIESTSRPYIRYLWPNNASVKIKLVARSIPEYKLTSLLRRVLAERKLNSTSNLRHIIIEPWTHAYDDLKSILNWNKNSISERNLFMELWNKRNSQVFRSMENHVALNVWWWLNIICLSGLL